MNENISGTQYSCKLLGGPLNMKKKGSTSSLFIPKVAQIKVVLSC